MTLPIPATIDDLTADWMAQALGAPITGIDATQIGKGIGVAAALYRVTLTCDDADIPDTVVVKLPALDEAAQFTASLLRLYIREVRFYQELAADSPIAVPSCHYADVDTETNHFVLVLDDVGDMRTVDQIAGMGIADAEQSVVELAAWHAKWWDSADPIVERGTAIALSDPLYPMTLPMVFAQGWEKVTASLQVGPEIEAVGPRWTAALPKMLERLSAGTNTLCHGDFRADNIMFQPDNKLMLLDFQLLGTATPAYDLSYFVGGSLAPEDASASEASLFERWRDALIAGGVPESATERLWDDYRYAALFCLIYPFGASLGMDLQDERQRGLVLLMNDRFARGVNELNLPDLL